MHLLLSTIALRPYVFIFLASFLFISIANFGLRTTILFTLITYIVALACEWSSVHNGFPFGLYHYIEATRGREIWIFGVPFMDSLSFTFLSFASYTLALLVSSPLYRRGIDLRLLDTRELRRAPRVWLMAALFMVMIDLVVDPLSVLGDRWFLGQDFLVRPAGSAFRRADQQLPRMVFRRGGDDSDFPTARRAVEPRRCQTRRPDAQSAVARADGTCALRGHRAVRNHDAVRHPCIRNRVGERVHLSAVRGADCSHRHAARQLRRRRCDSAPPRRFSI